MDIEKIQISHDVSEKKDTIKSGSTDYGCVPSSFCFSLVIRSPGACSEFSGCAMGASGAKMDQNLKNLGVAILFRKIGSILKSRFGRDLSCRLSALSMDIGRKGCDIECFFSPKSSDIC